MTIEIETKEGMSEKALNILEDLKDIIIEKIVIKDKAFLYKQKELEDILRNAKNNPETLMEHDDVWKEIRQ